jgi:hypothetical protein
MNKRYGFFFRKTIVQEDSDFVNNIINIDSDSPENINDALSGYPIPVLANTAAVYAVDIANSSNVLLISRDSNGVNEKLFETATVVIKQKDEYMEI